MPKKKFTLALVIIITLISILFLITFFPSKESIFIKNQEDISEIENPLGKINRLGSYELFEDSGNIYVLWYNDLESRLYKKEGGKMVKLDYLEGVLADAIIWKGNLYYVEKEILNQASEYKLYRVNLKGGSVEFLSNLDVDYFKSKTERDSIDVELFKDKLVINGDIRLRVDHHPLVSRKNSSR